jgi:hypothetical protein
MISPAKSHSIRVDCSRSSFVHIRYGGDLKVPQILTVSDADGTYGQGMKASFGSSSSIVKWKHKPIKKLMKNFNTVKPRKELPGNNIIIAAHAIESTMDRQLNNWGDLPQGPAQAHAIEDKDLGDTASEDDSSMALLAMALLALDRARGDGAPSQAAVEASSRRRS